jgi:hypothetical protein
MKERPSRPASFPGCERENMKMRRDSFNRHPKRPVPIGVTTFIA